ncbi:uncharacterized protein SPSK_10160 [Sporothrix schenckii 1099-18]|uniref:Uncharacterized protein n=1 Tax=Sporothrix schenckii 1099-18 TaxID=1397361 RepID=A0A0F2M780_SPOSC|nr:uncharacterized protein SPSK_10160 [Sporothrix schenckii 1099-18]KJR84690.1 hypothetical protein SPSK_10160 [Sporothrix schenckii 1099-18]
MGKRRALSSCRIGIVEREGASHEATCGKSTAATIIEGVVVVIAFVRRTGQSRWATIPQRKALSATLLMPESTTAVLEVALQGRNNAI